MQLNMQAKYKQIKKIEKGINHNKKDSQVMLQSNFLLNGGLIKYFLIECSRVIGIQKTH